MAKNTNEAGSWPRESNWVNPAPFIEELRKENEKEGHNHAHTAVESNVPPNVAPGSQPDPTQVEFWNRVTHAQRDCMEMVQVLRSAEDLCPGCAGAAAEHVKEALLQLNMAQAVIDDNEETETQESESE